LLALCFYTFIILHTRAINDAKDTIFYAIAIRRHSNICESYFETAKIVILKRQKSVFFQRAFKGDSKVIQTIFEQA
jgi:hypothetical protein